MSALKTTIVATTGALLLFAVGVGLFIGHVNDDAFITYRYSQALATGYGPYFNPGEHVEGYTNFLLMLVLAGVHWLAGAAPLAPFSKGLGVVGMAFAIGALPWIAHRIARGDDAPSGTVVGGIAAALVAVFPGVAVNATSGLETGLYAGTIVAALSCGRCDALSRFRVGTASGVLWAAATLTRPEGALIFAVGWSARFAMGVRGWRAVADAIPVAAAFCALCLFRYVVYDGELLPNTWYAKSGGYLGITPGVYVVNGAMAPFLGPLGVVLGCVGYAIGRSRISESYDLRRLVPIIAVGFVGCALPFVTGSDWMPGWRFSVPYLPALAIAIVVGWTALLRHFIDARLTTVVLVTLLAIAAFAHRAERMELKKRLDLRARGYVSGHGALARWLGEEALQPGDTVALMDIGIVGFQNPGLRILDVSGLTDRYIARSPGPFLGKQYDPGYVIEQRPEVIVLAFAGEGDALRAWTSSEERIHRDPRFASHYRRPPPRSPAPEDGGLGRIAAALGAERVFEHHYPHQRYLLAAFRRQD